MNLAPLRGVQDAENRSRVRRGVPMRADMAKVIVERPRIKGHAWNKPKGYRRQLQRCDEDGPPGREGIKARWQSHTRDLNEHLGPLRRYLDSQVGRPWDKVFSEICARIDRSSAVQDHVRDHVEEYVTRHVILIDGVPCSGEGDTYGKPLHHMRWRPWYVCPRTGLLRRVEAVGRKRPRRPPQERPPKYIAVGEGLQCRFLDGAWHLVTVKPLPSPYYQRERCTAVDVLLNRRVSQLTALEARRHFGAEVYAAARRPLARRELRQYPIPVRWW
jgi:hypothetical protein